MCSVPIKWEVCSNFQTGWYHGQKLVPNMYVRDELFCLYPAKVEAQQVLNRCKPLGVQGAKPLAGVRGVPEKYFFLFFVAAGDEKEKMNNVVETINEEESIT